MRIWLLMHVDFRDINMVIGSTYLKSKGGRLIVFHSQCMAKVLVCSRQKKGCRV